LTPEEYLEFIELGLKASGNIEEKYKMRKDVFPTVPFIL
jgi:hypothetical protein